MQSHYIITLGVFIGIVFLITLYYAKNKLTITAKQWDLDMITASDYTVSFTINQDEYEIFKNQHNEEVCDSTAIAYMQVLKERFQDSVSKEDHVFEESTDIRIATISYAFNNHKMIALLNQRGDAIVDHNIKEKEKIEKKIDELKDNDFDELSRPTVAYITFETQEGYERAVNMRYLISHIFEPAVEPTNIIWENSHHSMTGIFIRSIITITIIIFMLIGAFFVFFYLKKGLMITNQKYMNLNCDRFNENIDSDDLRLRYAVIDYYDYYYSGTATMMTGALQCFCDQYYNQNGVFETINHNFSHPSIFMDGKVFEDKICSEWGNDVLYAPFWSSLVSFVTVFLNYVLREVIMVMINKIGFHTESAKTNIIMIFIFVVTFFNTAILINLVNANLDEALPGFGIFNGNYPDFNFNWYSDIGATIVFTMVFNAFWPFIEIAMTYGVALLFRILDKGFS
jgi:hypothetical protein